MRTDGRIIPAATPRSTREWPHVAPPRRHISEWAIYRSAGRKQLVVRPAGHPTLKAVAGPFRSSKEAFIAMHDKGAPK